MSSPEVKANNSYRDIDNFAYHKNQIQQLFYYRFQAEKIDMARKTIKNKHRRLNVQITELSASQ